jgi:flagellar biosynthesis/type III secretory pathway protein FliH
MQRNSDGSITFNNQEDLETYISAHFEDKYSKIMETGFENGRKQAIEAIQQYPDLIGVNQFKIDIQAAIKAKKWYSEEEYNKVKDLLLDAAIQIDYLHNKFQVTGSGNAILSRIQTRTGIKL